MSYSNTLAHQLPPSANGHHRSVQKTNSLNEEEMEKYMSLSVPVLPAPAAVAATAMKTIPTGAVNKNNKYINDYNEEELHPATTPSPVPHIAAAEWRHHSHNSTHYTQSHSLERERNSLHKHHSKKRSESRKNITHGDKISNKHYNYHNGYDREWQQYTDNGKRRNNMKEKLQNVQHSSQPSHLNNHRYTSEEQKKELLHKENNSTNNNKKYLSSKHASNGENYTFHNHQHHHNSLHEQKLYEEEEIKELSKTTKSLPLRERSNKTNMNETMWNLRRLEAILQPAYNSTFHATLSLPSTSSPPPYASTRVECYKQQQQHEEQHNNNNLQAQAFRINFSKPTESFLHYNSNNIISNNNNNNTRVSVESASLHPIRTTPPLPSKAIITPTNINNNSKNNMLVVSANTEEHAYLLSEYVNKLEKEVSAISLEHAEACKLLVYFAEEREQFGVITNEQETRNSIIQDESRALFDLYVLFTTITLHRTETRWMQEMNGVHVEVQALREANTKLENNKINYEQEHNKREEYNDVARKHEVFANNEREQQYMSKKELDTDSRLTLAEAPATTVITTEAIKSAASDKTQNETTLQTREEYKNNSNNSTKNVELRFITFIKKLCEELHISCFDLTSNKILAPSEELLEIVMLKLKEQIKKLQEYEQNADKQKKVLHGYESQEISNMMTLYLASFMTHFTLVNELYNECCERKCEFANESAQLFLCVERIKLQHWHNDTEQLNKEKHIALLETLKSLRLQVEEYKGVLQTIYEEQQKIQEQHQTEISKNANASISYSGSISLSPYSARCVSELPYIPSRMKLHVEPANRSLHATEIDEIRKEAIRLGARESTNVVTNTISMPQISKENVCTSKSDNEVATLAACQKETNEITMKDSQEKPFKDILSNQLKEEILNKKGVQQEEKIHKSNNIKEDKYNTTSAKDNICSINNASKESASIQEQEKCHLQETKMNCGSTDNKVNMDNTTITVTPALTVPVIKRFVAKTAHSTSSYSSYSTYSRSSCSVASDANSYTSTVELSKELSKRAEANKITNNNSKEQESEKAATATSNVNAAVPNAQEVQKDRKEKIEGNKNKEVVSDEKLKGQDASPQQSLLEDNTKVPAYASLEEEKNNKKEIKVSEEHYKEEKKGNADASSYYSSSSSSSFSRSISVTSSSSSSSPACKTNKDDKKNSKRTTNHKASRNALTDNANESILSKVNKSSNKGNGTNVQKCFANQTEKMCKETDKKNSNTKQEKKESADNVEERNDNKVNYKKGKSHIEYDDSLTLDVSLTMDDSESDADTKSNNDSRSSSNTTEKQHKKSEMETNRTNAPSIVSNRAQSENSSNITTQNVKINSEIVADSVEKNKLKRRSSFDDDIDEQDVINKASANSNMSKIVANIAQQNQVTNMYVNSKSGKFK